jgi:hypothetical protein
MIEIIGRGGIEMLAVSGGHVEGCHEKSFAQQVTEEGC